MDKGMLITHEKCTTTKDVELEEEIREKFSRLDREVEKVLVGVSKFKETMKLAILIEGSVIAESGPGYGKSLAGQVYAEVLGLSHKRIEGVNGLMPFDIQGGVNYRTGKLEKGPIFHQLVLLEEINRVEAKTKSALLNLMQDYFVSYPDWPEYVYLPRPFIVVATYNPTERDKTVFDMTTAELDRFSFRVRLGKVSLEDMKEIAVRDAVTNLKKIKKVMSDEDILRFNRYVKESVPTNRDHPIVDYISRLAIQMQFYKREDESSASPRAVRSMLLSLVAFRIMNNFSHTGPEHVEHLIRRCWIHRLIGSDSDRKDQMIDRALDAVDPIG